jgi:hypothetical protein
MCHPTSFVSRNSLLLKTSIFFRGLKSYARRVSINVGDGSFSRWALELQCLQSLTPYEDKCAVLIHHLGRKGFIYGHLWRSEKIAWVSMEEKISADHAVIGCRPLGF